MHACMVQIYAGHMALCTLTLSPTTTNLQPKIRMRMHPTISLRRPAPAAPGRHVRTGASCLAIGGLPSMHYACNQHTYT